MNFKREKGRHYNEQEPWNYGGTIGSNKIMTSLMWTKFERKVYNAGWGEGRGASDRNDRRPKRKPEPKS
jgi:hypothetical protein